MQDSKRDALKELVERLSNGQASLVAVEVVRLRESDYPREVATFAITRDKPGSPVAYAWCERVDHNDRYRVVLQNCEVTSPEAAVRDFFRRDPTSRVYDRDNIVGRANAI